MSTGEETQLKPHRSVFVYTFGILSFISGFFAIVFGPIAWISGRRDLKEMEAGVMDNSGRGLTQAGHVLGMIMTIFWALVLTLAAAALVFSMYMMPSYDMDGLRNHDDIYHYSEASEVEDMQYMTEDAEYYDGP